ncbi:MAG: DUF4112 domain-containing protein [Rhodomicrobiaceae bacterium]
MNHREEFERLEKLAYWMDSCFRVPGTNIRFGLDGLCGLIPGLGDGVTALPAIHLIRSARRLGASRWLITRMAGNAGIDMLVGAIPLVGDLFDVAFKANRRNIALLRRHLEETGQLNAQPPMQAAA